MSLVIEYINITVNDVDEAVTFYKDALGLEVRNDVANGGFHWVTLGIPGEPSYQLVLSEPHAGRTKVAGDALQELLVKGELPMLVFRSDDLDASFEKARAAGAEILQEPKDQPWGPRDCAFRDPSGNMVRMNGA